MQLTDAQIQDLLVLVHQADDAIMAIYRADTAEITIKADDSPLTQADMASHDILTHGLPRLFPDVPVVSEEGDEISNREILSSDLFWLIDPIDGTKEFISKSDQFTICLGLIENNIPIFGIVSAPALGVTYYGGAAYGSFKQQQGHAPEPIHVTSQPLGIIMGSRMHSSAPTAAYIEQHYAGLAVQPVGSQLKFTQIAEGLADAYPRLGAELKLWDVAAGHAIITGAGGSVTRPDGSPLDYRASNFIAGDFLAHA